MRKVLISILLANIAVAPALAVQTAPQNRKSNTIEQRARPHASQSTARAPSRRVERPQRRDTGTRQSTAIPNARTTREVEHARPVNTSSPPGRERPENLTNARPSQRSAIERSRAIGKPPAVARAPHVLPNRPVVSQTPRPGTEPPLKAQARPSPKPQWNDSWRNNHRYDWRRWRRQHRNRFHLHVYVDPFGWAYYRYWIGWRLWPGYYASRYWITDPAFYRLPPPPPGTRWVRYYNDALLVDLWSGEVIDVIHDFFW
jgi:Ni/Co efflux regulator RcnB